MFRRAVFLFAGVVLAVTVPTLVACAEAPPDSGVQGEVRIGPINPVEQPGVDNTAPYSAKLTVRSLPNGKVSAEATSGADGRFRIFLAPGDYTLEPEQGDPLPVAAAVDFTVVAGRFTTVNVDYDSGIR
ncbi:MAG: hypothetical protein A2W26_07490 [Acidobacteria bacterium RBG_16_64_8]|nr:MAG: hypothetical protein A2W26_07490 [Acidobacteria bacterium RBG_16_64_8]